MSTSSAHVATDRPGRYAKQLITHMTRKTTGEWDDATGSGWLQFGAGRATLHSVDGALDLRVETTDDTDPADSDNLAQLEDVVGRHLVRFGARDELVVHWTRADGVAGTEQRNDAAQ